MYNSKQLHDKVIKKYGKIRSDNEFSYREKLNEMYKLFPEVKHIDEEISTLAVRHAARMLSEGITPEEAVNEVNMQKEKLTNRRNSILASSSYNEPHLEYACKLCKDTGVFENKRCKCYIDLLKDVMLSEIDGSKSISFNLDTDTFENFSLKWYSYKVDKNFQISPYENMKSVYAECRTFCTDFSVSNKNLYFYGSSGTGKTFMASCIANELLSNGFSVVYQSAYKLFQFMEDYKFCRIDRQDNETLFNSVYNADLLIIDDLGTEFGTAYTCAVLFDILNTRLLNEKSTIISTNLSFSNLESKYTDRVASRIIGSFDILRFFGDDIRISKKLNGR